MSSAIPSAPSQSFDRAIAAYPAGRIHVIAAIQQRPAALVGVLKEQDSLPSAMQPEAEVSRGAAGFHPPRGEGEEVVTDAGSGGIALFRARNYFPARSPRQPRWLRTSFTSRPAPLLLPIQRREFFITQRDISAAATFSSTMSHFRGPRNPATSRGRVSPRQRT